MRIASPMTALIALVVLSTSWLHGETFTQAQLDGTWTVTWGGTSITNFTVTGGTVSGTYGGLPVTGYLTMQPNGITVYSQLVVQNTQYQSEKILSISRNASNPAKPFHLAGYFTESAVSVTTPQFIGNGGTDSAVQEIFNQAQLAGVWHDVVFGFGTVNPCTIDPCNVDSGGNITGTWTFNGTPITGSMIVLNDGFGYHVLVTIINQGVTYGTTVTYCRMARTSARSEPFQVSGLLYPINGAPLLFLGYGGTDSSTSSGGSTLPVFGAFPGTSSGGSNGGSDGGCGSSSGAGGLLGLMLFLMPLRRRRL